MSDVNKTQQETMSLGQRLRQITNQARTNVEAQNFVDLLTKAAEKGEDRVVFTDLRTVLPIMIQSETALDWIRSNDLQISGQVNSETACWEFTVSW